MLCIKQEKIAKILSVFVLLDFGAFVSLSMVSLTIASNTEGSVCRGHYLIYGSFEFGFWDFADTESFNLWNLEPVYNIYGDWIEGYSKTKGTFMLYFGFYSVMLGYTLLIYVFSSCCRSVHSFEEIIGKNRHHRLKQRRNAS